MFEQRASVYQSDCATGTEVLFEITAPLSGMKCFPAEGNGAHMLINLRDVQMSATIIFIKSHSNGERTATK